MKILICSDGSPQAEQAMKLGASIAAGCGAEVTLFGISESKGQSDALLESLKRGQALLADRKIQAELITKSGKAVEEIIKRTRETSYDLVVIGAVQKESRGLFWMSSKSYKIIKEITPPVLSVAGEITTLARILVCSGGKEYIDNAVRLTGQIAKGTQAAVNLLHVLPDLPAIYAPLGRMKVTAESLLNSHSELGLNLRHEKELIESLGVNVELQLRRGSVLDGILREMRTGHYDLVVTGSALSAGLRTFVLGDITREILNRAHCPVLVVRAKP